MLSFLSFCMRHNLDTTPILSAFSVATSLFEFVVAVCLAIVDAAKQEVMAGYTLLYLVLYSSSPEFNRTSICSIRSST